MRVTAIGLIGLLILTGLLGPLDDLPAAMRLFVDVGHPHREVELLALLLGAGHVLNAVAVGEVAIGDDVEVGQLEGDRAVEAAEEGLPVLPVGRGGTTSKTTSVWSGAYTFMIASTSFALNAATKRSSRALISAGASARAGAPNTMIERVNRIAVAPTFSCSTICLPSQRA